MKKIYLLTLGLVAFVVTSMGQTATCPGQPTPGWHTQITFPVPLCSVIWTWSQTSPPTPTTDWYISVINANGQPIPKYGTGIPSNPTPIYHVAVDPTSGSASFEFDCSDPGFVAATDVRVQHIVANVVITTCMMPLLQAAPTPVKLTSFTGRLQNDNAVTLDWTSVVELDSYKYEVERSADGKYFSTVGSLKAAGASISAIKYTFNDQLPTSGAYFYRLKQLDNNGTFEYSKTVYVNSKKGAGVVTKVFPNPFKGEVQLIGATSSDLTPNNVKVFSISGQRVTYRFMGANSILIDPSAPDGVYILQVKDQRFKLVKNPSGTGY